MFFPAALLTKPPCQELFGKRKDGRTMILTTGAVRINCKKDSIVHFSLLRALLQNSTMTHYASPLLGDVNEAKDGPRRGVLVVANITIMSNSGCGRVV
jgi:hypothetical protein